MSPPMSVSRMTGSACGCGWHGIPRRTNAARSRAYSQCPDHGSASFKSVIRQQRRLFLGRSEGLLNGWLRPTPSRFDGLAGGRTAAAPSWVTDRAAAAAANRTAWSSSLCSASATARAPLKTSPAAVVSTAWTEKAGTMPVPAPPATTAPCCPRVTITVSRPCRAASRPPEPLLRGSQR